jgi:hypothetical protein
MVIFSTTISAGGNKVLAAQRERIENAPPVIRRVFDIALQGPCNMAQASNLRAEPANCPDDLAQPHPKAKQNDDWTGNIRGNDSEICHASLIKIPIGV